jgi:hypothetical protein
MKTLNVGQGAKLWGSICICRECGSELEVSETDLSHFYNPGQRGFANYLAFECPQTACGTWNRIPDPSRLVLDRVPITGTHPPHSAFQCKVLHTSTEGSVEQASSDPLRAYSARQAALAKKRDAQLSAQGNYRGPAHIYAWLMEHGLGDDTIAAKAVSEVAQNPRSLFHLPHLGAYLQTAWIPLEKEAQLVQFLKLAQELFGKETS